MKTLGDPSAWSDPPDVSFTLLHPITEAPDVLLHALICSHGPSEVFAALRMAERLARWHGARTVDRRPDDLTGYVYGFLGADREDWEPWFGDIQEQAHAEWLKRRQEGDQACLDGP